MATALISDYSRILKEFYETGGLHDAIDREIPLLARFQRMIVLVGVLIAPASVQKVATCLSLRTKKT